MPPISNYDWCDNDETLMRYDNYKSCALDEPRTRQLPPFLQFHRPPPLQILYAPSMHEMSPEPQPMPPYAQFEVNHHPTIQHQNNINNQQLQIHQIATFSLQNVAPRLLAGNNVSGSSSASKPGTASTLGASPTGVPPAPLPPYKTVICRAFYAKGKCFRAEPDK
ncbi:UNVERIFIED_CONTAM: hypothetical protein HDU68_005554, partial [Siphonaria sp. JEL0065]